MSRGATAPARVGAPDPGRRSEPRPATRPRAGQAVTSGRIPAPRVARGAVVLDALLRGRAWIALVFVLLAGIVFFNVDLLRMNRQIAVTAERAATVKRENARLRTDVARLGSSERIQRVAAERGLVLPAPGEVRYLRSNPTVDARRAAGRIGADEAAAPAVQQQAPAAAAPSGTGAPAAPAAPGVQPQE